MFNFKLLLNCRFRPQLGGRLKNPQFLTLKGILSRGGVWPGKNYKYFKKRKLNNEFQSFFLINILLPEIHSDIKMLYNFVNSNMYKMLGQKNIYIFKQLHVF